MAPVAAISKGVSTVIFFMALIIEVGANVRQNFQKVKILRVSRISFYEQIFNMLKVS